MNPRRALPLLTALAALLAAGPAALAAAMPGCTMARRALAAPAHRCCPTPPVGLSSARDCCRLGAPAPAPGPAPAGERAPLPALVPAPAFPLASAPAFPTPRGLSRTGSPPRAPPSVGSTLPLRI